MFTYTSTNSFSNEESIPMTLCEWNLPQYQLDYVLLETDVECNSTSNIINNNNNNNSSTCNNYGNSNSSSNINTFSLSNVAYANSNTISESNVPLFVAETPLTTITACVAVNNSLCHCHDHSKSSHQEANSKNTLYCASNGSNVTNNEDLRQSLELRQEQEEHCEQEQHRECLQNEELMSKSNYYSHASVDAASTVGLTPSLSCLQLNNSTCYSASSAQPRLCSVTREYASQERKSVDTCAGCHRPQYCEQAHENEELPSSRELCCELQPDNNCTHHTESINNANWNADSKDYTAENINSNSGNSTSVTNNAEEQKMHCNNIRYDPNAQSLITQPVQLNNYLTVNVVTDGKVYLLPAQETEAFIAQNTLPSQVETQVHYNIEPCINCLPAAYNPTPLYNSCNFESTNWLIPCEYTAHSSAHSMQPYNACACEYVTMIPNAQYNTPQTFPYNTESPSLCEMNSFSGMNNENNSNSNVYNNIYANSEANCNNYATAITNYNPAYDKSLLVEDSSCNDLHVLSDEKWSELLKLKGVRWHYDPYQVNLLSDDDDSNQFYSKETEPKITEIAHDCQDYNMNTNNFYSSNNSVRNNSIDDDIQFYQYNYNQFSKSEESRANKVQCNSHAMCKSSSKPSTTNTALHNTNDTEAIEEQEIYECSESVNRNNNANVKEQLENNNYMHIKESKQNEQCNLYTEEQQVRDVDNAPLQERISEIKKTADEEPELHNCCCYRRLGSNDDDYCNKKEERVSEQCTTHTPHRDEIDNQLTSSFANSMSAQCSPSGVTDTLADTPSSRRFPTNKTRLRYCVLPPSSTPLSEDKHTPSRSRRDRAQYKKLYDTAMKSVELFESKWSNFEPYRDDEKTDAVNGFVHHHAHLEECKQEQQYKDNDDDDGGDVYIKNEGTSLETIPESGRCGQDDRQEKDDTIDHAGLVRTPPTEEILPYSDRNNCNNYTFHDSSNDSKNHHYNWRSNRKYTGAINNKFRRVWLRDAQLQELHDLWYTACKTCRFDKLEKDKYNCANKDNTNNNNNRSSNDDNNTTKKYGEYNNHEQSYFNEPYDKYYEESCTYGEYKSLLHHHHEQQQRYYTQTKFVIQPNLRWEEIVCIPFKYLYALRHHHRRSFAVSDNLFSTNTLVVVDGDRGVEMGVIDAVYSQSVLCKMTRYELKESGLLEQSINTSIRVHREASEDELAFYVNTLPYLEACTLNFLYHLQHASYFNNCAIDAMEFIACEFQGDCQKLYVYYRSHIKVRILELATFLYQIYPCRIWIEDVGKVAA